MVISISVDVYTLLDSRTVRCSCCGLHPHTENQVPTDLRCRFTNVQKQLPTPFVVYADFESILKLVNGDVDVTQGVDIGIDSSTAYPMQFCVQDSKQCPDFSQPLIKVKTLLICLYVNGNWKQSSYLANTLLLLNQCCLLLQNHNRLPMLPYAQNRLVVKTCETIATLQGTTVLQLKSEFGKVRVIPQNMEKYLSLTVGRLKFINYFQFTPQGLDKLAKTLGDDEFRYCFA